MSSGNNIGKSIMAEWKADDVENWKSTWQDVAILEHPLESWINNQKETGSEIHTAMYNPVGEEALTTFTDGFVGSTMPKTEQWAEFEPVAITNEDGREIQPSQDTKKRWRQASDRFIRLLAESNFYEAIHETVRDGGAFGNGCPGVFQGVSSRLNFMSAAPGCFRYDEDEEGRPSKIRRSFKFTAEQIRDMFDRREEEGIGGYSETGLPEKIKKILEKNDPKQMTEKFEIIERIGKNKESRELPASGQIEWQYRAYIGEYVLADTSEHFFSEGYYEKPWSPWRLEKSSQEKYGRGLGMRALPILRKLQKMEKEYLRMLEKNNEPGWLVHEDSNFKEDGRAGAINVWEGDRDMKPEMLQVPQGFRDLEDRIEKEENKVRSIHFNDIFKIFLRDDIASKELKAAQVDAMMDEKLPLLVGVANRFLNECLKPLLRRAFMILWRGGAFDDLKLEGADLFRITFRSRIAMAVKTLENRGILQVLNATALVAQINPEAVLRIESDKMLGRLAENSTAPSEFVRTDAEYEAEVEKLRQRQAAMEAAQLTESLGSAAKGFA